MIKIQTETGETREIGRVFVAGPMRGIYEYNFPAFFSAAFDLRARGLDVHNPAEVDDDRNYPWKFVEAADANGLPEWARESCERSIRQSDAVVVLPAWHESEGVKGEIELADSLGLPVLTYPFLIPISLAERELAGLSFPYAENVERRPKIIVTGHGRHGKDTVSAMLAEKTGLRKRDSSFFACERAVMPYLAEVHGMKYENLDECFADRHNHREKWFDAISAYNAVDPARLARELFESAEIYTGMRDRLELYAIRPEVDIVIWVDASDRLPLESRLSMTIRQNDCDITIDNNWTESRLEKRVDSLARLFRYHAALT